MKRLQYLGRVTYTDPARRFALEQDDTVDLPEDEAIKLLKDHKHWKEVVEDVTER